MKDLGHASIDGLASYNLKLAEMPVQAAVEPGFLKESGVELFPEEGCDVAKQFSTLLLPGVSHWNHPKYFSFFPSNCHTATNLGGLPQFILN